MTTPVKKKLTYAGIVVIAALGIYSGFQEARYFWLKRATASEPTGVFDRLKVFQAASNQPEEHIGRLHLVDPNTLQKCTGTITAGNHFNYVTYTIEQENGAKVFTCKLHTADGRTLPSITFVGAQAPYSILVYQPWYVEGAMSSDEDESSGAWLYEWDGRTYKKRSAVLTNYLSLWLRNPLPLSN